MKIPAKRSSFLIARAQVAAVLHVAVEKVPKFARRGAQG